MKKKLRDKYADREAEKYERPIPSREFILEFLEERGRPATFRRIATDLEIETDEEKEALESLEETFCIAGRIVLKRVMGKASFIHIQDQSGRIQCYLRKSDLPEGQAS